MDRAGKMAQNLHPLAAGWAICPGRVPAGLVGGMAFRLSVNWAVIKAALPAVVCDAGSVVCDMVVESSRVGQLPLQSGRMKNWLGE
jgi:hypothetical protein